MPPLKLTKTEFQTLHDQIIEKFKKECIEQGEAIPDSEYQLYGFKEADPEEPNLLKSMERHPEVVNYLKDRNEGKKPQEKGYRQINPRYLYERLLESRDEKTTEIKLRSIYSRIYFLYLGCMNYREFREQFFRNEQPVDYTAYYYSLQRHNIQHFSVTIDFNYEKDKVFALTMKGFHEDEPEKVYEGKGKIKQGCLYVNLVGEDRELKFLSHVGTTLLPSRELISGAMLTVSSDNFPVSLQVLLLRNQDADSQNAEPDHPQAGIRDAALRTSRYLALRRQHFRIERSNVPKPADLRIGERSPNFISTLVGKYRVWRQDEDNNIVQTFLEINPDYSAYWHSFLHPYTSHRMTCRLAISTGLNLRLGLSIHHWETAVPIAYAFIDIPGREDFRLLQGVFISVGPINSSAEAVKLVLLREKSLTEDQFETRRILRSQVGEYIEGNEDLNLIWDFFVSEFDIELEEDK